MLNWLTQFSTFCFLDNQQYNIQPHSQECLVAAGTERFITGDDIQQANQFVAEHQWTFGHMAYHLPTANQQRNAGKKARIEFAPYLFFTPQIVLEIKEGWVTIHAAQPADVFQDISTYQQRQPLPFAGIHTTSVLSKEAYIKIIKELQQHIKRGDCYEINFCQEMFAEQVLFDPFTAYQKLAALSPNPFSAFYKCNDVYLLCASPERFLAKNGGRILSQPIKGTVRRAPENRRQDEALREQLRASQKEQSENVMVVDMVRNDLTRICKDASVTVDELYGIYTYPQVHQMISTISGELKEGLVFSEIIDAAFPMGSMTGAPKHRVMALIDEYEPSARGIFSGAVGYIRPNGDFDFNVVIRSIMYNQSQRNLSYQVGSGITFYSDAENEWEECLIKAKAIRKVLEG